MEPKVAEIAKDQAKQRLEQDPWMENIEQKMAAVTEASIRDAFNACFPDVDEHNISEAMNERMRPSLLLAGWLRDGKLNSGDRRNQVRFINPSPAEDGPAADYGFLPSNVIGIC